jgi:YegS/Rv2252/BmrU family lipid kinase
LLISTVFYKYRSFFFELKKVLITSFRKMNSDNNWNIILNPVSGKEKGIKRWPAIERSLNEFEISFTKEITQAEGHSKALIQKAIQKGARKFLLIGGDGTHFEAINAIYTQHHADPQDIALACLPAGTGNDWCRTVYPNASYSQIISAAKAGKTFRHDVGRVAFERIDGGRGTCYFLNVAGLGFDAFVAANYLNEKKDFGTFEYLGGLVRGLTAYRPGKASIRFEDQQLEGDAFILAAGICKYFGGGMKIAPDAQPDDGLFDLTFVQNISKLKLITQLPRIYTGSFVSIPEVKCYRTQQIRIEAPESLYLQVDGELMGHTPVEVEIIPGGINVVKI